MRNPPSKDKTKQHNKRTRNYTMKTMNKLSWLDHPVDEFNYSLGYI